MKIPKAPTLTAATQLAEVAILGTGLDLISMEGMKNALIPFGDLLINSELNGLKDPFIESVVNATIYYPAPRLDNLMHVEPIRMETQMLNLLRPVDPLIDQKWGTVKNALFQSAKIPLHDFVLDQFIVKYIDTNARTKYQGFQQAYTQLKQTVLPNQMPGPGTHGFEIAIPFRFKNNNDFPVTIPLFRSSVYVNNTQPFSLYLRPAGVTSIPLNTLPGADVATIGPQATQTLFAIFSFDMRAFNQGMYSLFTKQTFQTNLRGLVSYDFGYGPLYVGYDLSNMQVGFK